MSDLRERVATEIGKFEFPEMQWDDWWEENKEELLKVSDHVLALFDEERGRWRGMPD